MRHTLICTVGTSLKSNLERHPEGRDWLELYSQGRFRDLARALAGLPPENRLLGAEINSTDSIMAKGILATLFTSIFWCQTLRMGKTWGSFWPLTTRRGKIPGDLNTYPGGHWSV